MEIRPSQVLTTIFVVCLALSRNVQAVIPPPDGGYPGFNTAEGQNALFGLTTGIANTATGWFSLWSNSGGSFNTGVGAGSLLFNTGNANTGFGAAALLFNTTGVNNTAVGTTALFNNNEGVNNTANGYQALLSNTDGDDNTASGAAALQNNIGGSFNTANGRFALINNITGNFNIALGNFAGEGISSANNVIAIGTAGQNVSNSCYIGNIFGVTSTGGAGVFVNADGKLGTAPSSRRFKDDIKPMDQASEAILELQPVTFRYKKEIDPARRSHCGLVAEDVEKINPDLVVRDKDGKPYSVRYDQVNAMLLNEFLKEHRTVLELKEEIAALTSTMKQQAAQIEKVTAQIETSKVTSQVVLNDP